MPPSLTYVGAGLTAPADPRWEGGRGRFERRVFVGRGDEVWAAATAALMSWGVKTRSGFRVEGDAAVEDGRDYTVLASFGPWTLCEPVRVVAVVDEPDRRGFAYGTLDGHPVSGEEAFVVDRAGEDVWFTLRSVTSPGRRGWRLAFPAILVAQRFYRRRYLRSLVTG